MAPFPVCRCDSGEATTLQILAAGRLSYASFAAECGSVRVPVVGATVARVELKTLLNPGRPVRSFVRSLPRKGAFPLMESSGGGEGS